MFERSLSQKRIIDSTLNRDTLMYYDKRGKCSVIARNDERSLLKEVETKTRGVGLSRK